MHVQRGQFVVARQQFFQVGQAVDDAQVTEGAVLTVQIGDGPTVSQSGDGGQVCIVVATKLFQRGTARNVNVGQCIAPAVKAFQVRVIIDP